jgi:hypothetical protein
LQFVPRGQVPPAASDQVRWSYIADATDQPGAGGYHDDDNAGNPFPFDDTGQVFKRGDEARQRISLL